MRRERSSRASTTRRPDPTPVVPIPPYYRGCQVSRLLRAPSTLWGPVPSVSGNLKRGPGTYRSYPVRVSVHGSFPTPEVPSDFCKFESAHLPSHHPVLPERPLKFLKSPKVTPFTTPTLPLHTQTPVSVRDTSPPFRLSGKTLPLQLFGVTVLPLPPVKVPILLSPSPTSVTSPTSHPLFLSSPTCGTHNTIPPIQHGEKKSILVGK